MDIKEFGKMMATEIGTALGDKYNVSYKEIMKNNGIIWHALLIKNENEAVAPTIYLDYFFDRYKEGYGLERLVKEFVDFYRKSLPPKGVDVSFFMDFSKVCSKLSFKVVNFDRNKEKLKDIPYRKTEDLALIPVCVVDNEFIGEGTITITNQHLIYWEISSEELWENVMDSAAIVSPVLVENMAEILDDRFFPDYLENILVVTNRERNRGASAIFYPGVMAQLAEQIGGDYIIIPSSIHEVIVMSPDYMNGDLDCVLSMVKRVNSEVIVGEDILSNNIYYYEFETGKLSCKKAV